MVWEALEDDSYVYWRLSRRRALKSIFSGRVILYINANLLRSKEFFDACLVHGILYIIFIYHANMMLKSLLFSIITKKHILEGTYIICYCNVVSPYLEFFKLGLTSISKVDFVLHYAYFLEWFFLAIKPFLVGLCVTSCWKTNSLKP